MAINNNCLYNAALIGFLQGVLSGAWQSKTTATDYAAVKNAAVVFATKVDSLIAFDALITTGGSNTMLVDTASNTIQSNTQMRPALLQAISSAVMDGRYTEDATAADYANIAAAVVAAYTEGLLGLVSP